MLHILNPLALVYGSIDTLISAIPLPNYFADKFTAVLESHHFLILLAV